LEVVNGVLEEQYRAHHRHGAADHR
jgi:hypothetical protein